MLGLGGELEFPWWCVRTTFELLAVVCKKGHTGCSRNDSQSFRVACYFFFFSVVVALFIFFFISKR